MPPLRGSQRRRPSDALNALRRDPLVLLVVGAILVLGATLVTDGAPRTATSRSPGSATADARAGLLAPAALPSGALPGSSATAPPASDLTDPPPSALTGYQWPLTRARVMTWFAPVDDGFLFLEDRRVHEGLDLATYCGDPVHAAHDGTVVYAGRYFDPYMGYDGDIQPYYDELAARKLTATALPIVVVIDDGNGYRSAYVHLSVASVKPGDAVAAGQVIGREGATGHATGCHLHFEIIRLQGVYVQIAPDLVAKWHYPSRILERIDPLLVLSPLDPVAGRQVPGIPPPAISPYDGVSYLDRLAIWRARAIADAPVEAGLR